MDTIKTAGGNFSVKRAVREFVPKVAQFGIKTGSAAVKVAGKGSLHSSRSVGGPVRFTARQVKNTKALDKEMSNGANPNAAAAAVTAQRGQGLIHWQYRLMKQFMVRNLRKAANTIRAAYDARVIVKLGSFLVRGLVKMAVSMGAPAICILTVALLVLSCFGISSANTTFGGLISMPFEYTDIIVTDEYGMRYHPIDHEYRLHTGIDFGTPHYCRIMAAQSGTVIMSTESTNGYGNCIMIRHNVNGLVFYTLYAHLSQRLVEAGDTVLMGQVIGIEGGSDEDPGHGTSTGHHLHFEFRNAEGESEDPRIYLNYWEHHL